MAGSKFELFYDPFDSPQAHGLDAVSISPGERLRSGTLRFCVPGTLCYCAWQAWHAGLPVLCK